MFGFERPFPDELVSSALVRGCRHYGLEWSALGAQAGHIFCWTPTFLGAPLFRGWGELFRLDPLLVIQEHTLLPYLRAFSTQDADTQVTASFSSFLLPLTRVVTHRRLCPACVHDQLRAYGESFWCRSHHLPTADYCVLHGTALLVTPLPAPGRFSSFLLPHEVHAVRPDHVPSRARKAWLDLAQRGTVALSASQTVRTADYYLSLAVQNRWLREGQQVSAASLHDALAEYFGHRFLRANGLSISSSTTQWYAAMFRPGSATEVPTWKHLAIEALLKLANAQLQLNIGHTPVGARRDYKELDTFIKRKISTHISYLRKIGGTLTKTELLRQSGVWHLFRHRWKCLPRSNSALESFCASAACARPRLARLSPAAQSVDASARATRAQLIASGQLLGAKATAERLGVHWTEMAKMTREGRIITVKYGQRNYYPHFWPAAPALRKRFELAALRLRPLTGLQALAALASQIKSKGGPHFGQLALDDDVAPPPNLPNLLC